MTLTEKYDTLPKEVKDIINKYSQKENDYKECQALVDELETVGYTCDYYLDAEPYNLRRIIKKGNSYTWDDLYDGYAEDKGLDEADFSLESHGEYICGMNFLVLENKHKDEVMTFVLTGTRGDKGVYECVYNSNEIPILP